MDSPQFSPGGIGAPFGAREYYTMPKYCEYFLNYLGYHEFTKVIDVELQGRFEGFQEDINDLITFNISEPNLVPYVSNSAFSEYGNRFRIMRIQHRWNSPNGQDVTTKWTARHCLMVHEPD